MIDLSVLICSTHTRWNTFGQNIQAQLWTQYNALQSEYQDRIEIIMLTDNKKMMLGQKRNVMVDMAQGRYVAFVDDDDRVDPNYLTSLLHATETDADVITFLVSVSLNGHKPKLCRYSIEFKHDHNTTTGYERLPNHICAVKRELASQVSFPNLPYGEDSAYSKLLLPLLKTERHLPVVLYHYDYDAETTETQQHLQAALRQRNQKPIADVIILSNASNPQLREMTQKTIDTCIAGANSLPISVTVMEQSGGARYKHAEVVFMDEPFNYNAFANRGARSGSAEWIVVANNDLLFCDGWLHQLLAADHPLVSPKCPRDGRQRDIRKNTIGTRTGRHLSGWCFMIKRKLWSKIGGFDERVTFWASDDIVIEQARLQGVEPMLVPDAKVEHLQSVTLNRQSSAEHDELTWGSLDVFIQLYGGHRLQNHPNYLRWKAAHP